jgi:ribosomal-protein-alanine N-acetyltransferase
MNAVIRPIDLADLDGIVALEQDAHLSPWSRNHFVSSINAGYLCWCIEQTAQTICAYTVLMPVVDELHLLNLTVAPAFRRQGYAHYLLDTACEFARQNHFEKLFLEVRASNMAALSLYRQYGFQEIGQRPGYYPHPTEERETAIVMLYSVQAPPR